MIHIKKNSLSQVTLPDLIGENGLFSDGDWVESKDQDQNGDVRLIQLADVGIGEYINKSARFMTSEKAEKLRCTFLKPGDILIARMPDPIGRACVFPGDAKPCVTVVDICILRPDHDIVDTNWLVHRINSSDFIYHIQKWVTGTTRQRISRSNLSTLAFSLPPLEEQKRIAAILDKADAIRRKRQQAIKHADDFLRATFLDMFGDPVTNPKGWEVKPLSKLCDVRDGTHDSPKYVANGYPLVTSKNLKNGFIDFSDVNLITEEDFIKINKRSAVDYGDIIMPMIGTIGNPVLVETHDKFAIKNVALIKFKDADINNHYVLHLLKSHYFEWAIKDINRGGTQQFIALTDIRNLPIPVPSKAMMNEFDQFIDKFQSLGNRHDLMKVDSSKLFNSLTQRAFRGEV
ncbi:MAG TPA: restriction endonuclease subunit S [Smithellaceae bacterium]|nr:restriction endonuclease subunit S [Smithellaceae bacterium]HPL68183.1 restriction endonuclease subunit S [Smithellaceae bacterium]